MRITHPISELTADTPPANDAADMHGVRGGEKHDRHRSAGVGFGVGGSVVKAQALAATSVDNKAERDAQQIAEVAQFLTSLGSC